MILSQNVNNATQALVDDIDPDHFSLLELMSVKLTGGVAYGTFVGSGVVFRADVAAGQIYVVTAKHNLHVAARDAQLGNGGVKAYFKLKIRVMLPRIESIKTTEYAIAEIAFHDGTPDDHHYDVCTLRVDSRPLTNVVAGLLNEGLRGEFASSKSRAGLWGDGQDKQIFDVLSTATAKKVLGDQAGYKDYKLLQFGYGKIEAGAMGSKAFRRRAVSPKPIRNVAQQPAFMDATHEGYEDVFVFPAADDNTGAEGDSGGPVFAIDPTGTRSLLVGVHLGANFYTDRTDNNPNSATVNNAFTVLSADRLLGDAEAGFALQGKYG